MRTERPEIANPSADRPEPKAARRSRPPSAHARLKEDTASLHAAVEERMRLDERLASDQAYRALLERFIGFVEPVEAELRGFAWPDDLAFPARLKTRHLARDLLRLGHTSESLAGLPRCPDPPALPTPAAAFGCLYVLEGSTLGGRLILRLVGDALGRDEASGAAYFAGYGARTGAMWSGFLSALEAGVADPTAIEEAVGGAAATFAALHGWLGDPPPVTPPVTPPGP